MSTKIKNLWHVIFIEPYKSMWECKKQSFRNKKSAQRLFNKTENTILRYGPKEKW